MLGLREKVVGEASCGRRYLETIIRGSRSFIKLVKVFYSLKNYSNSVFFNLKPIGMTQITDLVSGTNVVARG